VIKHAAYPRTIDFQDITVITTYGIGSR